MDLLPQRLIRRATNTDLAIGALSAISELRHQLDDLEIQAIESARAKGASWDDIAEAVGVTRQALQQRLQRTARAAKSPVRRDRGPEAARTDV